MSLVLKGMHDDLKKVDKDRHKCIFFNTELIIQEFDLFK